MRRVAVAVFAAVVVGAAALVVASTMRTDDSGRAGSAASAEQSPSTTPTPATTLAPNPRGRRGSGQVVTFAFAGDVQFPDQQDDEPAAAFTALRTAGVDVINMANNHALDYGPVGMQDTFDAIASSMWPVVGIGRNAGEAYRPYRTVIKDQRIISPMP